MDNDKEVFYRHCLSRCSLWFLYEGASPSRSKLLAPPLPSVLILFLWMMRKVLKRMKNKFSDFYFSSYQNKYIKMKDINERLYFIHQIIFFLQKWSNLHERSGIGWLERKIKFQIFVFRVMVIFGYGILTVKGAGIMMCGRFPSYIAHI